MTGYDFLFVTHTGKMRLYVQIKYQPKLQSMVLYFWPWHIISWALDCLHLWVGWLSGCLSQTIVLVKSLWPRGAHLLIWGKRAECPCHFASFFSPTNKQAIWYGLVFGLLYFLCFILFIYIVTCLGCLWAERWAKNQLNKQTNKKSVHASEAASTIRLFIHLYTFPCSPQSPTFHPAPFPVSAFIGSLRG